MLTPIMALFGWLPKRVGSATAWLRHEVTGPAKTRRPGIAWTLAVTAMIVGTGNNVLLIKSGATGMPAFVTAFLTDIAASVGLWTVIRPKLREIDWSVKRAGLIFGASSAVSIWSGQEALHHAPYAMIAVLALVIGPMVAALVSAWKVWQIVAWVCVSIAGALLVFGVAFKMLSVMGAVSIFLNGSMYWIMVRTFTGLGRKEEGSDKDAVLAASAVSKLVTVPVLFTAFILADGPSRIGQNSAWATIGALGVGTLATISALCSSAAWKRGLNTSAHAQLQPAKPVLALIWGMVAGQKPHVALNTVVGYFLVCLGAGAVGRLFVEAKQKEEKAKKLLESSDLVGADKAV
ncbi:hypothetical protein [Spirillospora sp. CA-128828]|uniref:hypothetical protein n=1 Tax=Spirillospora sp. CA-128828 TaxID=3240033 RepID=UPI003D92534F